MEGAPPGTMVIGPVGSGKSTLVKALLGDVPCLAGRVEMHGLLAYVAQQAAIFHASVRGHAAATHRPSNKIGGEFCIIIV